MDEEEREFKGEMKQVYVGVSNEAPQNLFKHENKKQRCENKRGTTCQQEQEGDFLFFVFKKISRIESQAAYDQEEEEGGQENIGRRFCEIPDREKTR